jgi:hypothetical protein
MAASWRKSASSLPSPFGSEYSFYGSAGALRQPVPIFFLSKVEASHFAYFRFFSPIGSGDNEAPYEELRFSFEHRHHRPSYLIGRRHLIAKKVLRRNHRDFAVQLRNGPDPSPTRQLATTAFHKLRVRQTHVPSVMNQPPALRDNQQRLTFSNMNFISHTHWIRASQKRSSFTRRCHTCRP